MNKHTPDLKAEKIEGGVHSSVRHDSAHKHVAGTAIYIDDIAEPAGTLHAGLGLSTVAHGVLKSVDLSAVRACARCTPIHAQYERAPWRLSTFCCCLATASVLR